MVKTNLQEALEQNSKKRSFSGKYSSEKQAFYYELANAEGVDTENRNVMKNFILEKNKEIFGIIEKTGGKKEKGNYLRVIEEIRKTYNLPKYFPLDFLQKIVNFESNKKAFEKLNINYEDLLKLPKNKIIQDEDISKIRVPRIDDLVESQTDSDFGFMIEWVANAIDASTSGESIGRFGEGFLQSLEKIDIPGSKIIVSTSSEKSKNGYNIYLKKHNGELKFGSLENDKIIPGTSVKIEKQFTTDQIEIIKQSLVSKLKTNTKSNIILNGEKLNNLSDYRYINGNKLDLSNISTIELNLTENGFEVIDNGKGMTEEVVVKKLLRPNSTGNVRKVLSDLEVIEISKKETKCFYKQKENRSEKTKINLNISGINIESFQVSTLGNISDFALEFPSSSSLKDSRNEIDLSKEVSYSMGLILEKIENQFKDLKQKLDLLEISSIIYEKLKDRPTNIVDEQFVLGTIMKRNFEKIKNNLESEGISVLPANKNLVETLGIKEDIFYINEEFINFDINAIKNKKQIEKVESASLKGSLIGEKYSFYELDFAETAQYDYLVFEGNIFINSKLFVGKTKKQKDKIINILNKSVNLNTSYEVESQRNNYGRILTSGESFVVKQNSENQSSFKEFSKKSEEIIGKNKSTNLNIDDGEDDEKRLEIKKSILQELDNLRKKYGNKVDEFWSSLSLRETGVFDLDIINNKKEFQNRVYAIKTNFILCLPLKINSKNGNNKEIFDLISTILETKSQKITKHYLDFLGFYMDPITNGYSGFNYPDDTLNIIQTLNKIIDSDSNAAIELMERFGDSSVSSLFKDFEELEKKIEAGESNNSIEKQIEKRFPLIFNESNSKVLEYLIRYSNQIDTQKGIDFFKEQYNIDLRHGDFSFFPNRIENFKNTYFIGEDDKGILDDWEKTQEKLNKILVRKGKENYVLALDEEMSSYYSDNNINRLSDRLNILGFKYNKFKDKDKCLIQINPRSYENVFFYVKENISRIKKDYIKFKKSFIKFYEQNIDLFKGFEDIELTSKYFNEHFYNKRKNEIMTNELFHYFKTFHFAGIYLYFKLEDEIIKNKKEKEGAVEDYEEGLKAKFIWGDFSDYEDFIDGFSKQYFEYKHKNDILSIDFGELYEKYKDDMLKIESLEKRNELENTKIQNRTFGKLFKEFEISGEGICPMFFNASFGYEILTSNHFDSINNIYLEYFKKFENYNILDLKNDYFDFRFNSEEFLDNYGYVFDGRDKEYIKIRNEYYFKLENEYGISEEDFRILEYFLEAEYILTKNFYDKERKEKEKLNHEQYEYRIDETDSIFDDKFSFVIDILKGFNTFFYMQDYEIDSTFTEFKNKFEDIFGNQLDINEYIKFFIYTGSNQKILEKELLKKLFENPKYKNLFKKTKPKYLDIFTELSKKYPQDLVTFLQFLKGGGEFLKNRDLSVEHFEENMEIKCSDLIGITFLKQEEIEENNSLKFLDETKKSHLDNGMDYSINRDIIAGVNIAQDSVGMLYLREGVQNSVDAIKRSPHLTSPKERVIGKINIDFYSVDNNFVSSISDPVGMDLKTVIVKLLVPYNSGKDAFDDGVGQFGKGFFTFAPNSKQIRIKTSTGNGKVYYLELNPIKIKGVVSDFYMKISEKQEEFKGTTIERIDEAEGISGNLRAMIGVNLAKKYVGNIRGIDIIYNNSILNDQKNTDIISVSENIIGKNKNGEIVDLGSLELLKNKDNISRFTKNDLWISEIKDDLFSDLPDWMKEFFVGNNLIVNIPDKIPLIGSRNSIKNRKYYISLMKPYFYKQVINLVLNSYVSRDFKIPMMPEDYLMMTKYDFRHNSEILDLAKRFNNNLKIDFSSNEIELLKDKEKMREFIVLCNFEFKGEKTSLYDIKQSLHKDELEKSKIYEDYGNVFIQKISQATEYKQKIKDDTPEYNLQFEKIQEITGIEEKKIKEFITFIYKDFDDLIKKHFGGHFEITFYSGKKGIANNFSNHGNGMAFNVNSSVFQELVLNYKNPKIYEELIDIVTHEMTHNIEGDKWATHEIDEEHPNSFMRIHRGLLRDFVRN